MLDLNAIKELSVGVDHHLQALSYFTEKLREVKISLDELRYSQEQTFLYEMKKMKEELAELKKQLQIRGLQGVDFYERNIEDLKALVKMDEWPEAVPSESICDTPEKEATRAEGILDLVIGEQLQGLRFLDCGCGKGNVVHQAVKRGTEIAVGYDLKGEWCFESTDKMIFSTSIGTVKENAPYDIVLLHDVLDHIIEIEPIQALCEIRNVVSSKGKVYVRNHPFCSKHGGHLYTQENKAYLHLILDEIEIIRLGGLVSEPNVKVTNPIPTYLHWFEQAGFEIESEIVSKEELPTVFKKILGYTGSMRVEDMQLFGIYDRCLPFIKERIESHWPNNKSDMVSNMEIEFIEYILKPKRMGHIL